MRYIHFWVLAHCSGPGGLARRRTRWSCRRAARSAPRPAPRARRRCRGPAAAAARRSAAPAPAASLCATSTVGARGIRARSDVCTQSEASVSDEGDLLVRNDVRTRSFRTKIRQDAGTCTVTCAIPYYLLPRIGTREWAASVHSSVTMSLVGYHRNVQIIISSHSKSRRLRRMHTALPSPLYSVKKCLIQRVGFWVAQSSLQRATVANRGEHPPFDIPRSS